MLTLSQAPGPGRGGAALSAIKCTNKSPLKFAHQNQKPFLFSTPPPFSFYQKRRCLFSAKAQGGGGGGGGVDSTSATKQTPQFSNNNNAASPPPPSSSFGNTDTTVFVGQEDVPLEGVIQFEKPTSATSPLDKWGRLALLAGGDVLALLFFSAIGRYSHGFPVFDWETVRTADPFIAGWFLGAYFLGGYGEDGRAMNGLSKAVLAAAKSWAVGIPLGIIIRSVTRGHAPSYAFILVTMGSTAVLLVGWRALSYSILPKNDSKRNDVYRRGSPFELFELLTSLVRRW